MVDLIPFVDPRVTTHFLLGSADGRRAQIDAVYIAIMAGMVRRAPDGSMMVVVTCTNSLVGFYRVGGRFV